MKKILSLTILAGILTFTVNGAWAAAGPFPSDLTTGLLPGQATPNDKTGEFEVYQAIDLLLGPTLGTYTNNAQVTNLEYTGNTSTWVQTGNGANGIYAAIGLGASANNTFEEYTTTSTIPNSSSLNNVIGEGFSGNGALGNGTNHPFPGVESTVPLGTKVSFAIHQNYNNVLKNWYSNPTFNTDGMDHMIVYYLPQLNGTQLNILPPAQGVDPVVTLENPYLLVFEDLPMTNPVTGAPSDVDYNDLMVLVDGIAPPGFNNNTAAVPEPMPVALFGFGLLAMAGFALRRNFAFVK